MDSSWKNLQIRMEAAWNMRTTPKTKRPKTGDIISSAHSLDWNKKKVRQLQQQWNDEVTKLVTDRNKAISDVMVDILTLIRMDIKSASSVLISHDAAKMLWEKAYERGHSNGFNEVYYAIEDYEEVVIEALKGNGEKMELEEYLQDNNVTLWRNNRALGPQQTKSLADFDYAEGLENITGKMVWICDYRANADPTKKPIRGIEPTPVVVTDAKETNKTIYYSPIYFRPVKNGHVMSKVIAPMDNTGYRGYTGESVNIFYTVEDCVKCYREQVRQAKVIYHKELARITNLFNARIGELSESLIPFAGYNISESTVTVKVRAWTTTYQTAEFTFSQEMYPTEEKIDKLKKQALRLLPEKIRKETDWQAKGLVLRSVDIYVLVDGMNDKSAEEKVAFELEI